MNSLVSGEKSDLLLCSYHHRMSNNFNVFEVALCGSLKETSPQRSGTQNCRCWRGVGTQHCNPSTWEA